MIQFTPDTPWGVRTIDDPEPREFDDKPIDCCADCGDVRRGRGKDHGDPRPVNTKPLTGQQIRILTHALGLDMRGQGRAFRNRFSASPSNATYGDCVELTTLGLMAERAEYNFYVTPRGRMWLVGAGCGDSSILDQP